MNFAVIREPTILVTAVVYGVLAVIAMRAGLFGIWLGILLLLSFWRFCYSVLRAVAQGHRRIPPPDIESFNPVGQLGVVFHFLAFPGLVLATAPYQPAGTVVAILVACAFPASTALMGLTSNLAHAFNPAAMIAFARTLGRDYRLLVLGSIGIALATGLVQTVIVPRLGALAAVTAATLTVWAALAIFALIGSALRAHRLEFEIAGEVVPPEDRALAQKHAQWQKVLDIAYGSIRSGLLSSGYHTLHALVEDNGDGLEINHWLVENMLEWEDKQYGLEVAAKLMPRLLALEDGAGALDLYRRCRRYDPSFRPAPADAERLALHAAAFGHRGLADELSYNHGFFEARTGRDS